ncbi:MAG TPA: glycoprotein, partial [Pseudonocardiaceae bacterium]|nr:glycoprotein [Pseudonocardiaceae bacterium]
MRTIRAAVLLTVAMLSWSAVLSWSTALMQPAAAQQDRSLARLELEMLAPRVVTSTGPSVLTVTGEVVNTGDRTLSELAVRVQRDEALADDAAARAALAAVPHAPFVTAFTRLGTDLEAGQRTPFRIEVPLGTGPDLQALQITQPGVYPLLVNLNGTPDFGGPARLAAVPLLLPVLGLPGERSGGPVVVPPVPPPVPVPLTAVWPLVSEPARALSGPGEPLLLVSPTAGTDPLAEQLAPGGRLDGLLGALEEAVPPGSPLAGGLCVAVDPALLETVRGMAAGYRVADPTGVVDGTGATVGGRWLERLRAAVAGRCVLPMPYGDPDVVALSRAGITDLEALATTTGASLVSDLLGVQPLTGTAWPADGVLDERTVTDLTALDVRAVLLEPRGLAQPALGTDTVALAGGPRGLLADPLLVTALEPAASLALPA